MSPRIATGACMLRVDDREGVGHGADLTAGSLSRILEPHSNREGMDLNCTFSSRGMQHPQSWRSVESAVRISLCDDYRSLCSALQLWHKHVGTVLP
mmetsp:Transcript_5335/g.7866  ORF Transcript_5335/g.7866 Transcript_5335/m.7866 type:complete len:96 (-) Transcript_5335:90-377(-)